MLTVAVAASKHRKSTGWPASVRFGFGSHMNQFERFRFSVLTVPLVKGREVLNGVGADGVGVEFPFFQ